MPRQGDIAAEGWKIRRQATLKKAEPHAAAGWKGARAA
jgi:hypothetical protein